MIELQKRIYSFEYTSVQYEIDEIGFGFKRGAKSIKEAYDIYEKEYHRIMSEMRDIFVFQFSGPKSLTIIEKLTNTNLHDLAFLQFRKVRYSGLNIEVEVNRIG